MNEGENSFIRTGLGVDVEKLSSNDVQSEISYDWRKFNITIIKNIEYYMVSQMGE